MIYLDPLYGQLEITPEQERLFQTDALTRIRDVSLSAVPPLATPSGMIGSRFEHSVGVAYLAHLLTERSEFSQVATNLYLAGLFHDTGSPPFSHIAEGFLEELTGKNHEEFVVNVVADPQIKKAIEDYGGNPTTVLQLITGEMKPWSDLINGSIDLDNIDNSLRWGMACGILQNKFYDPEDLINAFVFDKDHLALRLDYYAHIQKWELCRRLVYDVVYSDINLTSETMLFRALEFAYNQGELKEDFFTLTDSQAMYVLEHRCNPLTQQLIRDMRHWLFFIPAALSVKTEDVTETFKTLCTQWRERQKIADIIAEALGISKETVTVYAGKDKGFKRIHLPFVGDENEQQHQPIQRLHWRIKVYLHPKHMDLQSAAQDVLEGILSE